MRYFKKLYILLMLSTLLAAATSCRSAREAVPGKSKEEIQTENERKIRSAWHDACRENILGNHEKALTHFNEVLSLDPGNAAAYFEIAMINHDLGRFREALVMAEKAAAADPGNTWYVFTYARLLELTSQFAKATEQYNRLLKLEPGNLEYMNALATALFLSGKQSDALKVYDRIEEITGVDEEISMQKHLIYSGMGKTDKAVEEIEKLIKQDPSEVSYYTIIAETYMAAGNDLKALDAFRRAEEIDPGNPYLQVTMAEFYRKSGDYPKAMAMLKKAFSSPEMDIDHKVDVVLAMYSYSEKDTVMKKDAYDLLDAMKSAHPADPKVYSLYGDFLTRDKKYREARDYFRMVISIDSSRFAIWEQLLRLNAELEDNPALVSESKRAAELFPEQPAPAFFAGMALYQLKEYRESITYFKRCANLIVDNDPLLRDVYAFLGDGYNQVKDNKNSDENYEKSLKIDPKNVYVLNNYSYYLALRGEQLEKAERMARQAVDLQPGNPSYLDTYAWVLYKLGRLGEAGKLLAEAIEKGGSGSAVILEHYGDVLWKSGEKDKALEYWLKAKNAGKGSEYLDQKINEKRLVE